MKHLKEFNEFEKVDEGLKEITLGSVMLLSSLFSGNIFGQQKKDVPKLGSETIRSGGKVTTIQVRKFEDLSDEQRKQMISKKWVEIYSDTNWKEKILEETKASKKIIHSVKFENRSGFESGEFVLTQSFKDSIDSAFEEITNKGGLPIDIEVVSSTDKTPVNQLTLGKKLKSIGFSSDNEGLSKARSESVRKYIVEEGVTDDKLKLPDDSVHVTNYAEKGSKDDPTSRYVYVVI